MKETYDYDAIIIGAGIGGLTAGAVLSRNGKKVLVLEKNPVPGGYAVNFKRGKYEFDASLHLINNLDRKGSISYSILEQCGIRNKVQMLAHKYLYRSIFPDIDIKVPQCNSETYFKILTRYFPNEKKGIEDLFGAMRGIFYKMEGLPDSKISTSDFISYLNMSAQEILDKFLEDQELKAVIAQLWPYYGPPPSKLSTFYFCYPWYDYTYMGGYYPNGGGGAIAKALIEVIKENNGIIEFNNEVEHILIRDNIAYGVVNNYGDNLSGKKIISNLDPRNTFYNLTGEKYLPADFISRIDKMEPSISAFVVYLGLNINFKKINSEEHTIFINPNYDPDKQFSSFLKNDIPNAPLSITLYSNNQLNYAPQGKSVINITTLAGYDFWKGLSAEEYKKKKREFANILIKRAEELIPNLSSYIEVIETATPLTMERYIGSYKGAIYGWSQCRSQSGSKRLEQITPVENLYLVGAWTQPGGGIKGVMRSGVSVADRILKENT